MSIQRCQAGNPRDARLLIRVIGGECSLDLNCIQYSEMNHPLHV